MHNKTFIFGGRFQPFHNDHMRLVEAFFAAYPAAQLILAIIRPTRMSLRGDARFLATSQEHFDHGRNPLTIVQIMDMISRVVCALPDRRVVMTLLPRLSKGDIWSVVEDLLPSPRVWLVPVRGEPWDEEKVAFLEGVGDEILRIDCPRSTSGYEIRAAAKDGRIAELRESLPPFLADSVSTWLTLSRL